MKSITWLTPTYFIDVDIQIVPELSKFFKINWIISGGLQKPTIYANLKKLIKTPSSIEYYHLKYKWYSPLCYLENRKKYHYIISKADDLIYIDQAPQLFDFMAAKHTLPKRTTIFATHNVKTPKGARHEKLARFYMNKLLHHFENFQTFSKNQNKYLNSLVSNKNILYAPLTLKSYGNKTKRNLSDNIVNFLSFGHIRQYKRLDLLILAAQQIYEETNTSFKVTIAGSCPQWTEYKKLIKYPHLFDLQIGFIRDEDVPQLFANANYLVLPYQDLAQSGAITVAFNYNVPVITSDIPQFKEFVNDGENGFLFKSESVKSLKECMKKVLSMSAQDYRTLLNSTKSYVDKNYSLQAIATQYISYLNKF